MGVSVTLIEMTHSSSCGPKESRFAKIRLNLYAICIMGNEMEWNKFRPNVDSTARWCLQWGGGGFEECMVTNFGQYDDINDVERYIRFIYEVHKLNLSVVAISRSCCACVCV